MMSTDCLPGCGLFVNYGRAGCGMIFWRIGDYMRFVEKCDGKLGVG